MAFELSPAKSVNMAQKGEIIFEPMSTDAKLALLDGLVTSR